MKITLMNTTYSLFASPSRFTKTHSLNYFHPCPFHFHPPFHSHYLHMHSYFIYLTPSSFQYPISTKKNLSFLVDAGITTVTIYILNLKCGKSIIKTSQCPVRPLRQVVPVVEPALPQSRPVFIAHVVVSMIHASHSPWRWGHWPLYSLYSLHPQSTSIVSPLCECCWHC